MNDEILRLVDTIHRSKEIDKELIFLGIESALLSAVKKKFGESEEAHVSIDRRTGETRAFDGENEVAIEELGRLAAMTGKQVLFQKIREAERDRIFDEFEDRVATIMVGIVQRQEGPNLIINLGKVEGFLPRSEQVMGERFKVGERIKVLVKDLRKNTNRVKILLSRTSPDLVRRLFELEVPEIADKVIEIKQIAREPGYRTKIAVTTHDSNVDCVGACVGVRGSRIKNIVDELFGEKIDIVRWNESIEVLIVNSLRPAEISSMDLDFEQMRAQVYVREDQQSLAIGKRGQNVRLASKLTGWDLDIVQVTEERLRQMRNEDPDDEDEGVEDDDEDFELDEELEGRPVEGIAGLAGDLPPPSEAELRAAAEEADDEDEFPDDEPSADDADDDDADDRDTEDDSDDEDSDDTSDANASEESEDAEDATPDAGTGETEPRKPSLPAGTDASDGDPGADAGDGDSSGEDSEPREATAD